MGSFGGTSSRTGLTAVFVHRPVLTLMVVIATLVIGGIGLTSLPLRFMPEASASNQLRVWIPVRLDRSPQEVSDTVADPLVEQLRTIPGIREVRSDSDSDSCRVDIELDPSMDPVLAGAEVRDRLQRAQLSWPEGVDRYFAWREDASSMPLWFFQLLTPERNARWDQLVDETLRRKLEAVDGVGRVNIWGVRDSVLRIWLDEDALLAQRVPLGEVLNRLRSANLAEPVGELDDGDSRLLLRVDNRYRSTKEIADFPIRPGLRLGDVARIERERPARGSYNYFIAEPTGETPGQFVYGGQVYLGAGANPVDTSDRVKAAVDEIRKIPGFEQIGLKVLLDQGAIIRDSLDTLKDTALGGGLLAFAVLLLFIRRFTTTLVVAAATPLALCAAGAWLYLGGDSLNLCTMAGMTIGIGMVVDNAVVVLESIRRRRMLGDDLVTACIQGTREVSTAVGVATLTTVAVFLPPVFTLTGGLQPILAGIAVPLSVALVSSLGLALWVLPAALRQMRTGASRGAGTPVLEAAELDQAERSHQERGPLGLLIRVNQVVLVWALRHRMAALLLGLVSAGAILGAASGSLETDFSAGADKIWRRGDISIRYRVPRNFELPDTFALLRRQEAILRKPENLKKWKIETIGARFSRSSINWRIDLLDGVPSKEQWVIRAAISKAFPEEPGVRPAMSWSGGGGGGGASAEEVDDGANTFEMQIYGKDPDTLIQLASGVRDRLELLEETTDVDVPAITDEQEVVIDLDRERMQETGVQPDRLFGSLTQGLQGREVGRFLESGREVRLIAEYDRVNSQGDVVLPDMQALRETQVWDGATAFHDLDDLGAIRFAPTLEEIEATNGRTSITIRGTRAADVSADQLSQALRATMNQVPLPRGYSWQEGGTAREKESSALEFQITAALIVVLLFLLMAILFESVVLPLSIMATLPVAFLGGILGLVLWPGIAWCLSFLVPGVPLEAKMDPMAGIGVFVLFGLIVNNGIVLLDQIVRLRRSGMERSAAILEGARARLRPIAMTGATTVVGLAPMAIFGEGDSGLSYVSMAVLVSGGLITGTLLTAIAVPVSYTLADDFSNWLRGLLRPPRRGQVHSW